MHSLARSIVAVVVSGLATMGSGQSFDFNPDSIFLPAPAPAPDDSGLLAPTAFDSSSMDANAEWLLTSNNDGLDPGFLESSCVEGSDPGSSPFGKTRRHRKREDSMCLQESPQKLKTPVNPGLKVPGLDEIDQNLQQSSWFSSDDPGDQCYPPYTVALCCTGSNPANWATGVYILVEGCSRKFGPCQDPEDAYCCTEYTESNVPDVRGVGLECVKLMG